MKLFFFKTEYVADSNFRFHCVNGSNSSAYGNQRGAMHAHMVEMSDTVVSRLYSRCDRTEQHPTVAGWHLTPAG